MSSISALGAVDPSQFLRSVGGNSAGCTDCRSVGPPSEEVQEQLQTAFQAAADSLGIDTTSFAAIGGQIQEAVQAAIQSSDGTDPRGAVEQAINAVLQDNGIDPQHFRDDLDAIFHELGVPAPGQGAPPPTYGAPAATASAQNPQLDLLKQFLESLNASNDDSSSASAISGFFASAEPGTFVNAVA